MEPALLCTRTTASPDLQLKDSISWLSWKHPNSAKCCDHAPPSSDFRFCRLEDSLEVLESMDKEGTLNMRKIKHAKFYDACKRHNAVKEAFRFTQLIKNPSLSTYNQLLSVCAKAKDIEGAFEVLDAMKKAGLDADCIIYTTLISACAKAGKIDRLFQVYHKMVSMGVQPNIHTYGALIDGCARVGEVGKAFGVYGIMRSKKMKPDQVILNSLITACGRAGAVERAFDVLFELASEPIPIEPNHITIGALIKACTQAGQAERAIEVYKMMGEKGIHGSIVVYTEAVHACSKNGDLDTAFRIFEDLKKSSIQPDQVFFSALIDVAGHAGNLDTCFDLLKEMEKMDINRGIIAYSSVMGACSNNRNWERALQVYREIQEIKLTPNIDIMNALLTALCDAGQLEEAKKILQEMRHAEIDVNKITYTVLLQACEQADDIDFAFDLHKRATSEGIVPSVVMCESIIGLCLKHIWKLTRGPTPTSSIGTVEAISFCGRCTSWALSVYRKAVTSGVVPTMKMFSQLLGCLRLPRTDDDKFLNNYVFAKHGSHEQPSLIDGFGVYDPRALALYEEASTIGIVPTPSSRGTIFIDTTVMPVFVAEVYILTVLKGLKYRLAAGARMPSMTIKIQVNDVEVCADSFEKSINLMSRTGQAVTGLLRSLRLNFHGYESSGKIKITSQAISYWLQPRRHKSPTLQISPITQPLTLAKRLSEQQRILRYMDTSMWSKLSAHQYNNKAVVHNPQQHLSHLQSIEKDVHMQLVPNGSVHALDPMSSNGIVRISSAKEEVFSNTNR